MLCSPAVPTRTTYYPERPSPAAKSRAKCLISDYALPDAGQTFKRSLGPAAELEYRSAEGSTWTFCRTHCSYLKLILKARAKLPVFAGTVWRGVRGVDLRVRARPLPL
jgi:hypothetical protein